MLALIFFCIALLYSSIGFGGGSSYLAALAIWGIPFELMPKLGLICNLLVVSGGVWHYYKKKYFNRRLIFPFVLSSVPFAFLGGMYPIKEETFLFLLSISLGLAGVRLLFGAHYNVTETTLPAMKTSLLVGAVLGLLSGLVGLGGGIFLSPLMLNFRWGMPKEVAATASAFIFLNSLAGLGGQLLKGTSSGVWDYWPLFLAVILGGQIGSMAGTSRFVSHNLVQRGTATLILIISLRLLFKIF
jgi:uncharacterized protein